MKHVWLCETCKATHDGRSSIWECPGCSKEVCDTCFDRYMHCKNCAKDEPDYVLAKKAGMEP